MGEKIIVCGNNGAGKSTLGAYLAKKLGYPYRDIEDYYFPGRKTSDPYRFARTAEQVGETLLSDMKRLDNLVLASVRGNYGSEVEKLFTLAVFIETPKMVRLERIRERSRKKFGDRMEEGGELFEEETRFFAMAANRSDDPILEWLDKIGIPVIRVDGTWSKEHNAEIIIEQIQRRHSGKK